MVDPLPRSVSGRSLRVPLVSKRRIPRSHARLPEALPSVSLAPPVTAGGWGGPVPQSRHPPPHRQVPPHPADVPAQPFLQRRPRVVAQPLPRPGDVGPGGRGVPRRPRLQVQGDRAMQDPPQGVDELLQGHRPPAA